MKSGVWVLDHDTGYRNIKKDLMGRYGKETVQRIWEKAGANWEELCARYTHLPGKIKQHTDGQMFRMASVYMAQKEAYPEIIRFSCEIDEWIYGNLPGLKFSRSGTLGTGADKCDFCLKRAGK